MVKDVRSLWGVHDGIILAGKRISPQNEAEGMDSNIHYIPKIFKLRWLKIITRFTWLEACIDYNPGSCVSLAIGSQLLLSVAEAHQAFEKVTEPWDPVHYYERIFEVFYGLNCFNLLDSRQQFFLSVQFNWFYHLSQTYISSPNMLPQSISFYTVSISPLIYEWCYMSTSAVHREVELPLCSGRETAY